jgi:pimeloyl-ACP methyl ester carboxylesterase
MTAPFGAARADDALVVTQETFAVRLQPGTTARLGVTLWKERDAPRRGVKVLALHGLGHTARSFEPLARVMLKDRSGPLRITEVLALDMPGRGGSGLEAGSTLRLGELSLNDYTTALLGVLSALQRAGRAPDALLAHSMGGLVATLAQARLVAAGSDLARGVGVRTVVLLAPVIPLPKAWPVADNGQAALLAGQFVRQDSIAGTVVDIPPAAVRTLFFEDLDGEVAAGAPSAEALVSLGYVASEPFLATAQLVRAPDTAPPSVPAGIFEPRHHTGLALLSAGQDFLLRPEDHRAMYVHLTSDRGGGAFRALDDPEAVHDFYISSPELLGRALRR